jgi:hypothetical protein
MIFLTKVLSVEETLMYFSYRYDPNLTHKGKSVITAISSKNGYRNLASSKHPLVHPWSKKFISKGHKTIQLVKKSACAKDTKVVHAHVIVD